MKTLEERLAELKATYEQNVEKAKREYEVSSYLPPYTAEYGPSAHFYPLYGRDVSIHFRRHRYSSISEGLKQPDPALAKRLAADLGEPAARSMWLDGCRSFPTTAWSEAQTEEKRRTAKITPVAPYFFRLDGMDSEWRVEWAAFLGGRIAEVQIDLGHSISVNKLGRLELRFKEYRGERVECELCNFYLSEEMRAAGGNHVKWGRGDKKYANDFTVYFAEGSPPLAKVLDMLG